MTTSIESGIVLAVNGGGAATQAVAATLDGTVVGSGAAGSTSLAMSSIGAAAFNLREAVRQAVQSLPTVPPIHALVMGVSGMDTAHEEEQARSVFSSVLQQYEVKNFELVNDVVTALEAGTDSQNAIVLLSGIGSHCYGRNELGQVAHASGMDALLSDQGSGYMVGRATLRMAVKSYDGRTQKSILEKLVCEHFQIASISVLKDVVTTPPLSKAEVASVAQCCEEALISGDWAAKMIAAEAVLELTKMTTAVSEKLQLQSKPYEVLLAGDMMKHDWILTPLLSQLKTNVPQAVIKPLEQEVVFGALKRALRIAQSA